ncbi:GNAT family N-acetyltransferase [Jannaschia sp. R86511]|uniref:GNAT family N-acetyltransferase n=1 Tax=Jannaschia sp. R86511 TaxID=3093853 RepID=UPI0036D30D51
MSWEGLAGGGTTLSASPAESARFGLTVERLTVGVAAPAGPGRAEDVAALLDASEADVVVVRLPADAADLAAAVATGPRTALPAGTLVYWEHVAGRGAPGPAAREDVEVLAGSQLDPATAADLPGTVEAVVTASFTGYGNHYSVDPLMPDDLALAGYVEWAQASVAQGGDDVHLLRHAGRVAGLATTSRGSAPSTDGRPGEHLEILLAGLVPGSQGQGLYGHLLQGVLDRAVDAGLGRVVISTQAHNTRVQRAWARAGFEPFAAVETVHCVAPGLLPARR